MKTLWGHLNVYISTVGFGDNASTLMIDSYEDLVGTSEWSSYESIINVLALSPKPTVDIYTFRYPHKVFI
jgi:hypothetical protein